MTKIQCSITFAQTFCQANRTVYHRRLLEGVMTTIREVAERAGVSLTTVSHVINNSRYVSEATRQRVLDAMKATNYRPNAVARSLRSGKTHTLGLILPDSSNPFFAEVGLEVEKV